MLTREMNIIVGPMCETSEKIQRTEGISEERNSIMGATHLTFVESSTSATIA